MASQTPAFGDLPVPFEKNLGQTDASVQYLARGSDYTLFLTKQAAVLSLESATGAEALQVNLVRANPDSAISGVGQQQGKSNYLIGNDPSQWHTDVPRYDKVEYQGVYSGIDVVYYGNEQRQLEYDFIVASGADTSAINLDFAGAAGLSINAEGDLVIKMAGGDLIEKAPVAYQEMDGARVSVAAAYEIHSNGTVGFTLGTHDASKPVTIDPVLTFATYLGGSGDDVINGIAVDPSGNIYVVGTTSGGGYPTTAGAFKTAAQGGKDVFVTKLSADGSTAIYSTYIGGLFDDVGNAIAVDNLGFAYITGSTASSNTFPTTAGVFQTTNGGGASDAFVVQLRQDGASLFYGTFLGGSGTDIGNGITVDSTFNAYVTGQTNSSGLQTAGAFQSYQGGIDGFVAKINSSASAKTYFTYIGGTGDDIGTAIALDSSNNAYITGSTTSDTTFPHTASVALDHNAGGFGTQDAFAVKVNSNGTGIGYGTFIGGTATDQGTGIAVDTAGNAYITGLTQSTNFPTANAIQSTLDGTQDAFVTKLNSTATTFVYSTYLGGDFIDAGRAIAVNSVGEAYVVGSTQSPNFPLGADPIRASFSGGTDGFAVKLTAAGNGEVYGTYLGGGGDDIATGVALNSFGDAFIAGQTTGLYPTTAGVRQPTFGGGAHDGFITRVQTAGSVSIGDATTNEGNSGTKVISFTVTRSGGTAPFDVNYATSDNSANVAGGDYVAKSGTVHFDDSVNSHTITVTINGDSKFEANEQFLVGLSGVTSGAVFADDTGVGTIGNDDSPSHDFSGDGKSDILLRSNSGTVVTWDMNDAQVTSTNVISSSPANWNVAGTGDFNGDGKADILWRSDGGTVVSWDMNDSQVTSTNTISSSPANWKVVGTGDFNGDGKSDILWRSDAGTVVSWDMNDGQVTSTNTISSSPANWKVVGTGDFNGDGKSDILWRSDAGTVVSWDMDDGQVTSTNVISTSPANWKVAGVGDFNGDGKSDILWRSDAGTVVSWDMNDGQVTSTNVISTSPANWQVASTGDYNGDGKSDILWRSDAGTVVSWDMNDAQVTSTNVISTMPADWHIF